MTRKEYYEHPNFCMECGCVIELKEKDKPFLAKKRKFCNKSCAATFNNRNYPKQRVERYTICDYCGRKTERPRNSCGSYRDVKFCPDCRREATTQARFQSTFWGKPLREVTKQELLEKVSRATGTSMIRAHARTIFKNHRSGVTCCEICGRERGWQICHIKKIADFSKTSEISEINDINNLIALCPNHHWDLDHGALCVIYYQ